MIEAGRLNHLVTIQHRVAGSPDRKSSGAADKVWTDLVQVWAEIEYLRGKEFMESQAINSAATVRIRIRERSNVDATMRVTHDSKVFSIEAVLPPRQAGDYMHLMCSQGANNG